MTFAVYASSRGNYFWREIAGLLAAGLKARRADESGWRRADRHLVVGPQEFFTLGAGAALQRARWPEGVILYDAEQDGSRCAAAVDALRPRAHAVWTLDRARASRRGDAWVPLGFVPGCPLFGGERERPIDVLFIGGDTPRRRAALRRLEPVLRGRRAALTLTDDEAILRRDTGRWLDAARRAKIVLNIRRGAKPFFEWHRIGLHGLGQGALVLTEPVGDARPLIPGRHFVEAPLRDFPRTLARLLDEPGGVAAAGAAAYRRLCRLEPFLVRALRVPASPSRRAAETAASLLLSA